MPERRLATQLRTPPAKLTAGTIQRKCDCGAHGTGQCGACAKERESSLQRAAISRAPVNGRDGVPPIVHEVLNSPGHPLDHQTRSFLEPRFGFDLSGVPVKAPLSRSAMTVSPADDPLEQQADDMAERALRMPGPAGSFQSPFTARVDFSGVRIHNDALAAQSSRAINAKAYTVGQDIVFDHGRYAPGTSAGQKLLAHELAHTIQQTQRGPLATASLQRTIGDGHDLTSPRFSLIEDLEAVFDDETTLVSGDTGRGVQAVQQALYDLGFLLPTSGADGRYGPETANAVRAFQGANPPLTVNGRVNKATMEVLNTRFGPVALPPAATRSAPWTVPCVRSIVCPWSPNTISTLRTRITLKSFDSIFWDDEEWDGASWVVSPFPGAGYNTGTEIGVLNSSCEAMSQTLYHEVLHANQPTRHHTTRDKESYAYRIGEEFSIAMGLSGDPGLRSTDARGRQFADPAKITTFLAPGGAASYPGVPAGGGAEQIVARVGADQVRVRRANGSFYVRPATVGEKVAGPIRTVNEVTHPRPAWTCP